MAIRGYYDPRLNRRLAAGQVIRSKRRQQALPTPSVMVQLVEIPTVGNGITEQGTAGTTSFIVGYPTAVNAGELLVMHIGTGGLATTTPAGWTLISGASQTGDSSYGFYQFANGTEGGTTFTVTIGTAGRATAIMARFTGVASIVLDVPISTGQNTGTGSTVVVASQTTLTDYAYLVTAVTGNAATGLTWTQPPGFVLTGTSSGTGKGSAMGHGVSVSPPGATGTETWTWSQTNLAMDAWMIALRPAPPPAPPPPAVVETGLTYSFVGPGLTPFNNYVSPWFGADSTLPVGNFLNVNAEVATITVAANNTSESVALNSGGASFTVTGQDNDPSVGVNAGNASFAVTANNASGQTSVNAGNALLSVAANGSTPQVSVNAGIAAIAIAANQPGTGRTPTTATVTVASNNITDTISPNAGVATVAVAANNSTSSVSVNAGCANVALTAQDAVADIQYYISPDLTVVAPGFGPFSRPSPWMGSHVFVSPDVSVSAQNTNITVSANQPGMSVSVNAGVATVTVIGNDASTSIRASATSGGVSVTANSPTGNISVNAGVASVSISTNSAAAQVRKDALAGVASVSVSGFAAEIPVQFIGPPDVVITTRPNSTTITKIQDSIDCISRSLSTTVTSHQNNLLIEKVVNAVTVHN